ncbi:MAG: hypothetical protein KAT70_04580, partial [Thermoplasmata archaeon]|nr:hypothetical protein [Thermoplasmata archaeon]
MAKNGVKEKKGSDIKEVELPPEKIEDPPEGEISAAELVDRIEVLQDDNLRLIEEARRLENEKHYLETDNLRLQREIQRLKAELARIKRPPLIVGSVKDVLGEGQIVVKSSTGPDFIVNTAEHIRMETVVIGSRVALNRQTLTIMGVL